MDVIIIIISIFIPPLGAFLKAGITGQFWLNLLLTILFFVPGIIHAIWLNVRKQPPVRVNRPLVQTSIAAVLQQRQNIPPIQPNGRHGVTANAGHLASV